MAYCGKCGTRAEDGMKFCPSCGNPMEAAGPGQQAPGGGEKKDFSAKVAAFQNTADTTSKFDRTDVDNNKVMAILAYFGPLCFIPMFAAKDSRFARFHANQGLILFIACVAWGIAYGILSSVILLISWRLYFLISIIGFLSLIFLVLAIIGIINAAGGKAKELPLIGRFRILK